MQTGLNFFLTIFKNFSWLGNWLFLFIALTECIPFFGAIFPGGTLISIGGFLAAQGYFNVWDVIIFSGIGAVLGDYMGYSLGRYGRPWLQKTKIINPELMKKSEELFKKHGNTGLLWGRFIGAIRAVIPFSAGASKMKHHTFLFWNVISAILWSSFNVGLGYFSGSIIAALLKKWSHRLGLIVSILIVLAVLYWLIKKHGHNLWRGFKKQSHIFTEKLLAGRWYTILDERYPIVSELTRTHQEEERIFGYFLLITVLIFFYLLALVL